MADSYPDTLGRYRLLRPLAKGGMGELYVGRHVDGGPEIVLKCVRASAASSDDPRRGRVRMFLDEARLATLLSHENIVRVHAVDYDGGYYFMVMERLRGWDLAVVAHWLAEENRLMPLPILLRIAVDVCRGLHAAHECRNERAEYLHLVHRDVSPSNLFVTEAGVIKILDFGIAKSRIQVSETQVGTLKGKAAYMSPEQVEAKPLDARSDIFSLGVVLHELVTGEPLFRRDSLPDTLHAVVHAFVPPPLRTDDPSQELARVITRSLQRDRDLRHASAAELGEELSAVGTAAESEEVAAFCRELCTGSEQQELASIDSLATWARSIREALGEEADTEVSPEQTSLVRRHSDTVVGSSRFTPDELQTEVIRDEPTHVDAPPPPSGSDPRRRQRWQLASAVAAALLLALVVALLASSGDGPPAAGEASPLPVTPTASPDRDSSPDPGVTRRPHGKARAKVRRSKSLRPPGKKARPAAKSPATLFQAERRPGRLTLVSEPWAEVYLDDQLLGETPLVNYELPAGRVKLKLVNRELGRQRTLILEIPPGEAVRRRVSLD